MYAAPLVAASLQLEVELSNAKGAARKELEDEYEKARAAAASALETDSFLPNFWCVQCDVQCLPRDISVMRPDSKDLEKIIGISEPAKELGSSAACPLAMMSQVISERTYANRQVSGRKPYPNQDA